MIRTLREAQGMKNRYGVSFYVRPTSAYRFQAAFAVIENVQNCIGLAALVGWHGPMGTREAQVVGYLESQGIRGCPGQIEATLNGVPSLDDIDSAEVVYRLSLVVQWVVHS